MRQFQGMIAEYERAQIAERCRRGKLHRARAGAVSVLSGAPYGYRYVKKTEHADAFYEIDELEAPIVREIFDRYVEQRESIVQIAQVAHRAGRADPNRNAALGLVDDLGDPAQPGLHRVRRLTVAGASPASRRSRCA